MFQHIVYSLANRQWLFAYVKTCTTRLDTTTKFMVVVTSLFNLVISSFPDNMFYHVWTWLLINHDGSNNVVQVCYSSNHEQFQHAWTSLSTTLFKLASSTMFKPVNNHVQAGQLNHVQACQQPCSSWPAQPCSRLSTTMFKLASSTMCKPMNNHVQAGLLNHVQACQQPRSNWPAQPCSSLSN